MSNPKDPAGKGKPERFKAKEGAFAAVTSDYDKIGQIKEIGTDGLSFQYIDTGNPANNSVEIEIVFATQGFYLQKISAEVVADIKVDNHVSLSSLPLRELEVRFGKMNANQKLMLDYFLKNYTIK